MAQYKLEVQGAEEFEQARETAEKAVEQALKDIQRLNEVVWNMRLSGVLDIGEKHVERPRWLSVDMGLPEDSVPVIVCWRNTHGELKSGVGYHVGGVWNVFGSNAKCADYWMGLPLPPKEEPGREDPETEK